MAQLISLLLFLSLLPDTHFGVTDPGGHGSLGNPSLSRAGPWRRGYSGTTAATGPPASSLAQPIITQLVLMTTVGLPLR